MLETEHLTFQYNNSNAIFSFPNINLSKHENLLILGKSGIGKTTLLHLLAGILEPLKGKIIIDGTNITNFNSKQLDQFRGKNIGLVFQKKHAIATLNVIENLQARLFLSKQKLQNDKIDTLLKQLGLSGFEQSKINELSEGQLQRLGIALAVVHNPKVILADEPTSSLDDENCKAVIELLINQAELTKANLIIITHDFRVKPYFNNSITL